MTARLIALGLAAIVALSAGAGFADDRYQWLRLDRHYVKWGNPVPGTGGIVTYAFVTAPVHSADARNCRDLVSMDGLLAASGISHTVLEREARAAFAMWEAAADIRFRRAADPSKADILIGAQAAPRGIAFADVAYGAAAGKDARSIRRSLVCFNPEQRWKVGFGGKVTVYDLRYALAHEIGHAIGLDHAGPSGQLMSFRYEERFRELQPGDIAGAVSLYGPRRPTMVDAAQALSISVGLTDDGCPAEPKAASPNTALSASIYPC